MSRFDPQWLTAREAADHRSRNLRVRDAAVAYFKSRTELAITDLGCGTGSNWRALHAGLPSPQHWRLVDHDRALIAMAKERLALATHGIDAGAVEFLLADLATDIERVLAVRTDLVTAAALFDLVSADWLQRFTQALARRALPLYAVLTYNGKMDWRPAHPDDAVITAAFHAHQERDKGFGAAAGPQAAALLCQLLEAAGYQIVTGESPWILTPDDRDLVGQLIGGIGEAVSETERLPPVRVSAWCRGRLAFARCEVGHMDLFAHRPSP
jgi:SAM-dependent methyltransferase